MCLRRCQSVVAGFALVFALVACDSDSTGPEGPLSEQEIEVMMEALMEAGGFLFAPVGFGFAEAPAAASWPSATAAQSSETFDDIEHPCPVDGAVHLAGQASSSESESGWTATFDITQTHQDCVSIAHSDGSEWTFNGNPNVTVSGSIEETEQPNGGYHMAFDMSQGGAVAWENASAAGSCSIDVQYDMEIISSEDTASWSVSIQGSVCGHSISFTDSGTDEF